MSLADVQSLVDDLVRDTDQVITSSQRDTAIANAVLRYSADAPRRVVEDVVVDSGGNLPAPSFWLDDSSRVLRAEYPIGVRPASYIPGELIDTVATPAGVTIVLLGGIADGETVRLAYTAAHALEVGTDTIPAQHRRAVAALAGSDLCGQLAAQYSNESAPTISADTVDHKGKSDRWRARSRDLMAEYTRVVGSAPSERTKPASVDVPLVRTDSLGGRRLFHPTTGWPRT
ncbi:MAG: hypothetical protein ABIQ70_13045 [Dokdonella sp.]